MALALNKIHSLGKSRASGKTMGRISWQRAIFDETDLFRVRRNHTVFRYLLHSDSPEHDPENFGVR
jgi:hypothetical protein